MRASAKTTLGIDVTETRVSIVVLQKAAEGFRVLEAARFPLPEGTFEQGRIADPAQLVKVLKHIKGRHKIRTKQIALALPVMSTVTRVVQLDEEDPQRVAQFVQHEIREYAAFSGREIVSDFRVLVPARPNVSGKILMTATENHTVATAMWACRRAGLGVGAIEPAGMACIRGVSGTRSPSTSTGRILLAVLREGVLSLCVLRRGILDFIRTEKIDGLHDGLRECHTRVADEINAVIRFYEGEGMDVPGPWSVVVLGDDDVTLADDVVVALKTNVAVDAVDVRTTVDSSDVVHVDPQAEGMVSVAAFGLALRFMATGENEPCVNLLPPEATQAKSARTNTLLAANGLAALILLVVLVMGGLRLMTKRVNQNIVAMQREELKRGQHDLSAAVQQLVYVEQRSELLADEVTALRHISESHLDLHWTQLLDDIKRATPDVLCVTDLAVDAASDLSMEGLSHSYEAVHLFVEMLNRSEQIGKASVVEAGRSSTEEDFVQYIVRCTLASRETL